MAISVPSQPYNLSQASRKDSVSPRIPITVSLLESWGGKQVLHEARLLVEQGLVLKAEYEQPWISGTLLHNSRPFNTRMRVLPDGNVESECPCYANRERGIICSHVIALGLVIASQIADPMRQRKMQAERRRADQLAAVDESQFIKRAAPGSPNSCPASVTVRLDPAWIEGIANDAIPLLPYISTTDRSVPISRVPNQTTLALSREDDNLLFALEDIAGGPVPDILPVSRRDFMTILSGRIGETLSDCENNPILIHAKKVYSILALDLLPESGALQLSLSTTPPFLPPGDDPVYIIDAHTAWVYAADHLWPIGNVVPEPYQSLYQAPLLINRPDILRFLHGEVPMLQRKVGLSSDISTDLFTIDPANPAFRLEILGSPASLAATLYAQYGDVVCIADKPDKQDHFSLPDPDDCMRYLVRNRQAEQTALLRLRHWGLIGESGDSLQSLVGTREVRNFLGSALPALRRDGWKIDLQGRIHPFFESLSFVTPVVQVSPSDDQRWFDVSFRFEDAAGATVRPDQIHDALRKQDASIEHNGSTLLLDAEAITSLLDVFGDCGTGAPQAPPGCFRLSSVYAPYVEASLRNLEGIDIEDTDSWRRKAHLSNRLQALEPIDMPPHLDAILRPYQKDGVSWLRFLEANGFCGLLADEMGLGKTLQTLAWLQLPRLDPACSGKPALVVCPTSLVQNWAEEAARFAPALNTLPVSGNQREDLWQQAPNMDLVITSYALLRRDLEACLSLHFAAVILDEAQHIKNHSTRNAQAAKQLRAHHKLVLTGTPVENGVADLWSIMDFLMPGYLGSHQQFRTLYERPIAKDDPDAAERQTKLRRKLHPFLLRRKKRDVAKELPPKIERVASCDLSPDQKVVYRELLAQSRRHIADVVAARGFQQARMEILTTLLRLRQACCHLDLLKWDQLTAERPSAKMELFSELVDEAIDGGHRILVFSQFVTMLHILRKDLENRGIPYCYLDGSTKDRMAQVHRFNTTRSIPVFLISLKAGGTGLNLTGADMVIHYDPWWNPAVENQATDRAYRIGQKRTVYSVKLITKGTVEEKVLAMQNRKMAVIQATVESPDDALPEILSWEDVQQLLEMD